MLIQADEQGLFKFQWVSGNCSDYSHSIVPVGLGVKSNSTRFMPLTSCVIRSVICCSSSKGTFSTVAVIASIVFTARMMAHHSSTRLLSFTPTDYKSGIAVKYCQTLPSRPFFANSSRRMASDSRTASSLSLVMAPRQRTPRPGPGKGCL